jgi:hypothetical protein
MIDLTSPRGPILFLCGSYDSGNEQRMTSGDQIRTNDLRVMSKILNPRYLCGGSCKSAKHANAGSYLPGTLR